MGHVWTEQSDLDRLDELEDVVVPRLEAETERLRARLDRILDAFHGYEAVPFDAPTAEDAWQNLRSAILEASSEPRP